MVRKRVSAPASEKSAEPINKLLRRTKTHDIGLNAPEHNQPTGGSIEKVSDVGADKATEDVVGDNAIGDGGVLDGAGEHSEAKNQSSGDAKCMGNTENFRVESVEEDFVGDIAVGDGGVLKAIEDGTGEQSEAMDQSLGDAKGMIKTENFSVESVENESDDVGADKAIGDGGVLDGAGEHSEAMHQSSGDAKCLGKTENSSVESEDFVGANAAGDGGVLKAVEDGAGEHQSVGDANGMARNTENCSVESIDKVSDVGAANAIEDVVGYIAFGGILDGFAMLSQGLLGEDMYIYIYIYRDVYI
jgi:hypothetical protein